MKICILGDGLTSLTLAKALINIGVYVDMFSNKKKKQNKSRTLGLSKSNIKFFEKNILNIEKLLWEISKIEIYSENLNYEKILNFENKNERLFSVIKNYELNDFLLSELNKSKLFSVKKKIVNYDLIKDNYKLIVNCDYENQITKKFFYKKFYKDYGGYAHTAIIEHKKILNNTASQTFTKKGPIAFLPISNFQTSVVYSVKDLKDIELTNLVKKYNNKYEIKKIRDICNFKLNASDLRSYHYKNILAFGDMLHKLQPLAGQGFNMSIRDIKKLIELIKFKIDHGLDLDNSICLDFEKVSKHRNYLFSRSIDFVYEFFNLENKIKNSILSKAVKLLGKNNLTNKFFIKFADKGITI